MKILVIAEHDKHGLKPATLHTVTAAKQLGEEITVLVMGANCKSIADKVATADGVKHVLLADNAAYEHQLAENCAELVADIAKEYQYVLAPATTFGKNLLPRIAALLEMSMIGDVIKIESPDTFVRPIYAGNALAMVQTEDAIKILTIRTTQFATTACTQAPSAVKSIDRVIENSLTSFVEQRLTESSRPELTNARIIISGGRGLKSADNFHLLEKLADHLGAAVGASRAAVDAGFAPNDYQVGQTGKIVAPDLYIAVGISGAIQHLAGMKDSKVIVAINNDPEAPIFQVADYGLVGDLFKILPELQNEIEKVT